MGMQTKQCKLRTAGGEQIVGLISDTHGLMRPEALAALQGVDLIVHAGDIGKPEVIVALKSIAPVAAIRGNNDIGPWAQKIPDRRTITVGAVRLYVIHDSNELKLSPAEPGVQVVICGHSHKPSILQCDGVFLVNPGSAGPRRFKLPVAVARLGIKHATVTPEIIELKI